MEKQEKTKYIDPKDCKNWNFNDRSGFELNDVYALSQDIKKNGQTEPVIVRPSSGSDVKYEIIAGSRRWKACLEAEIKLFARIIELSDEEAAFYQIKENEKKPLSDYSKGIHFHNIINANITTVEKLAQIHSCSKNKIYNYLTFAKVPSVIWESVIDMSRVSARSAMCIYTLANKGDNYIEALIDIAEEIRKGAGANKIEKLVNIIINGGAADIDYQKQIQTSEGKVIGHWSKNGIVFNKEIKIDQNEVERVLIQALAA